MYTNSYNYTVMIFRISVQIVKTFLTIVKNFILYIPSCNIFTNPHCHTQVTIYILVIKLSFTIYLL